MSSYFQFYCSHYLRIERNVVILNCRACLYTERNFMCGRVFKFRMEDFSARARRTEVVQTHIDDCKIKSSHHFPSTKAMPYMDGRIYSPDSIIISFRRCLCYFLLFLLHLLYFSFRFEKNCYSTEKVMFS